MPGGLRFGLCIDQNLPWPTLVERWQYYESLGFDSLWDCDHLIQPSRPTGPYLEGWTVLAGLAARTERVRIGVLVSSNTFRHPALLAKEAVTVDHISNGRLELGLGAGWYAPEHEMFGLDFSGPAGRVARFREAVELVDRLLRAEVTPSRGRYYRLHEAPFRPGPIQRPRPPLTIGAKAPKMLRIVAEFADSWNSSGSVEEVGARNRILDEHCAAVGRDPSTIRRSLYGWATRLPSDPWKSAAAFEDIVGRYREVGIEEFIMDHPRPEQLGVLERVAGELIPALRAEATAG